MKKYCFILLVLLVYPVFAWCKGEYQVDMIVFANPQTPFTALDTNLPLIPPNDTAHILQPADSKSVKPYQLLTPSHSHLKDEYYLLGHKSSYLILGHYSWIQKSKEQPVLHVPYSNHQGWQLQGTVQVQPGTYYTINSTLQCSPPSHPKSSFTIVQKQRLVENKVYYLDNEHLGIVVTIHVV